MHKHGSQSGDPDDADRKQRFREEFINETRASVASQLSNKAVASGRLKGR